MEKLRLSMLGDHPVFIPKATSEGYIVKLYTVLLFFVVSCD